MQIRRPPGYQIYLLTIWVSGPNGEITVRVFLEEARTGIRYGFTSLEDLIEFLEERMLEISNCAGR